MVEQTEIIQIGQEGERLKKKVMIYNYVLKVFRKKKLSPPQIIPVGDELFLDEEPSLSS